MRIQRRSNGQAPSADADEAPVPGKETQVQRLAAQGVSGSGAAMPFADQIATSFGAEHADTVHGIRAHTGGAATAASEDIGAKAYATGNNVAFAGTPDLHTAAHEAAHVVQQRQGVHLKGGVGADGDQYERHADAVADRVVAGTSAADLLGARGAGGGAAVQLKGPPKKDPKAEAKAHEEFESAGPMVCYAIAGVFRDSNYMMESMPSKYVDAMHKLYRVVHGDGKSGHQHALAGRERRAVFDEVYPIFKPFTDLTAHFVGDEYGDINGRMNSLRNGVLQTEAYDRVENAIVFGTGKDQQAMDMPDDKHPDEQAKALKGVLPSVRASALRAIAAAKQKGDAAGIHKQQIEQLGATLELLQFGESFLGMSDQELHLHIDTIKAKASDVTDKASFVKKVVSWTSYAMKGTLSIGENLMKLVGDKMMAVECSELAQTLGNGIGSVLSVVQIVHGITVLLDDNASRDDKIGAGVEIAAGVAFLAGGSAASMAITGPFMLVKGAQYLYSEAVIGWDTDLVRGAFQELQRDAGMIARSMEHLAAAKILQSAEQDPERRKALADQEIARTDELKHNVLSLLRNTEHVEHGDIYSPGNIQIISDAFAHPRNTAPGAQTQEQIIILSHLVSQQIAWCFKRGPAIVQATASNKSIVEVDGIEEKLEKNAKKK